ncbi:MAG: hypothetical protein ACJAQT_004398 [Akkermansiaceae bacterium]|jgi:hypothetical protein
MKWMIISMVVFIASEIVIGYFLGNLIVGRFASMGLKFLMQGLSMLIGFYVGGFLVGVISPGVRIWEPAAGAFCSVGLLMVVTLFTPSVFYHFSLIKVILGGIIAFALALYGARMGERVMRNRLDE